MWSLGTGTVIILTHVDAAGGTHPSLLKERSAVKSSTFSDWNFLQTLVSVSTVGTHPDVSEEQLAEAVKRELGSWWSAAEVGAWAHLCTYRIPFAQPMQVSALTSHVDPAGGCGFDVLAAAAGMQTGQGVMSDVSKQHPLFVRASWCLAHKRSFVR